MSLFDLKSIGLSGLVSPWLQEEGAAYASRPDGLCPGDALVGQIRVRHVRAALRRQPSHSQAELLRLVSDSRVCAVDLPGESARHRDLSAGVGTKV